MNNEKKEFTPPVLTTLSFDQKKDVNAASIMSWSIGDVRGIPNISDVQ